MGDLIVLSFLAVLVGWILYGMVRNVKQGKTGCGCDCSKCGKCCSNKAK